MVYNSNAKLNWEKVDEVRLRVKNGETRTSVALDFGVSVGTISAVCSNQVWVR